MNWRMNKHSFWEPKITAEMNQLSAHFSVRNTGNWRDNKHALGFLKKWEETLDYVSCFSLHFFRALAASCVLYNRTEHSQGFSIC